MRFNHLKQAVRVTEDMMFVTRIQIRIRPLRLQAFNRRRRHTRLIQRQQSSLEN